MVLRIGYLSDVEDGEKFNYNIIADVVQDFEAYEMCASHVILA